MKKKTNSLYYFMLIIYTYFWYRRGAWHIKQNMLYTFIILGESHTRLMNLGGTSNIMI